MSIVVAACAAAPQGSPNHVKEGLALLLGVTGLSGHSWPMWAHPHTTSAIAAPLPNENVSAQVNQDPMVAYLFREGTGECIGLNLALRGPVPAGPPRLPCACLHSLHCEHIEVRLGKGGLARSWLAHFCCQVIERFFESRRQREMVEQLAC